MPVEHVAAIDMVPELPVSKFTAIRITPLVTPPPTVCVQARGDVNAARTGRRRAYGIERNSHRSPPGRGMPVIAASLLTWRT